MIVTATRRMGAAALAAGSFAAAFSGAFVLYVLLRARPLPVVCVAGGAGLLVGSFFGFRIVLWQLEVRAKRRVLWAPLVCAAAAALVSLGTMPLALLSCEAARGVACISQARELCLSRSMGEDRFAEARDPWGGSCHLKESGDGTLLVWSDGPDGIDDGARRQIAGALFEFDRAFGFGIDQPFRFLRDAARRFALWEMTLLWRRLRGDIVWDVDAQGAVRLKVLADRARTEPSPAGPQPRVLPGPEAV